MHFKKLRQLITIICTYMFADLHGGFLDSRTDHSQTCFHLTLNLLARSIKHRYHAVCQHMLAPGNSARRNVNTPDWRSNIFSDRIPFFDDPMVGSRLIDFGDHATSWIIFQDLGFSKHFGTPQLDWWFPYQIWSNLVPTCGQRLVEHILATSSFGCWTQILVSKISP